MDQEHACWFWRMATDSYWLQLFAENSEVTPGPDGEVCCDQVVMSAMIS